MGLSTILRILVFLGLGMAMVHVNADDDPQITPEDLEIETNPVSSENTDGEVEHVILSEDSQEERTEPSNVIELETENAENLEEWEDKFSVGTWFVYFYSPTGCELCDELAPIWEKVAKISKEKKLNIHVARMDIEAENFARLMLKVPAAPYIKLWRQGSSYALPKVRELRTAKQYIKYATKTFKKEQKQEEKRIKLANELDAKKRQDNDLISKVIRLTPKTFASAVGSGDWLIDFYGAKCVPCKKLDSRWEKIAFYAYRNKVKIKVARFDVTQDGGQEISKSFKGSPWPKILRVKNREVYLHPDSKSFMDWDVADYIEWGEEGFVEDYSEKFTPDIWKKWDKRAARKAKYGSAKPRKDKDGMQTLTMDDLREL